MNATIDLYFPIHGREIPVDHGYLLFSALSNFLEPEGDPWLHQAETVGLHPIRGRYCGKGRLRIGSHGKLGIRLRASLIPKFLPLAGKVLRLGGDSFRVGIPIPRMLKPSARLYAHLVTTRNGHEEDRFDAEIARQLQALGIHGAIQREVRRTFTVKEKRVVAHSLLVSELTAEESVRLQEAGLGGRRKLGCGVFLPVQ